MLCKLREVTVQIDNIKDNNNKYNTTGVEYIVQTIKSDTMTGIACAK